MDDFDCLDNPGVEFSQLARKYPELFVDSVADDLAGEARHVSAARYLSPGKTSDIANSYMKLHRQFPCAARCTP
jgi:hypothetical protein